MNATKYVAMDVHKSMTLISVLDCQGCLETQAVVKSSPKQIRDFIMAQSGTIHLAFEEGTHSQWLFELLGPLVAEQVVCNPRLTGSSKTSNKNDELDRGDYPNKNQVVELISDLPLLPVEQAIAEIVEAYILHKVMPGDPVGDALHWL